MKYEGRIYRPPSEAWSLILQASLGCSHNRCVYCDMYRDKAFSIRPIEDCLADLRGFAAEQSEGITKLFVADGDSLILPMDYWAAILTTAYECFPHLEQVSCYARSTNLLDKGADELKNLRRMGLNLLYLGPESGDSVTLKKLVKGETFEDHVAAAKKAHEAGFELSVIVLLGAGGIARSQEHAKATGQLVTEMDPHYLAALTLVVIPDTPLYRSQQQGQFQLPDLIALLAELRTIVATANPKDALFRTNHASNYLPLAGRLPADRERLVEVLEAAIDGRIPLRPEWSRGL